MYIYHALLTNVLKRKFEGADIGQHWTDSIFADSGRVTLLHEASSTPLSIISKVWIDVTWRVAVPAGSTMSDQEFETFQEFVILDFLSPLKTPILLIFPDHL